METKEYATPTDRCKAQLAIYEKMYSGQPLQRYAVLGHENFNRLGYVEARSLLEADAIAMLLNLERGSKRPVMCCVGETHYRNYLKPYKDAIAKKGNCYALKRSTYPSSRGFEIRTGA